MSKGTINKVILIGRLGADPDVRFMPSGSAVCNLRLATNDGYKDRQSGEWKESTEWHRVVLFNRTAEIAGEYLKKGGMVYIEGRIRTNKWQDQSGQDRYTTEIVATEMQLLGGGGQGGSDQGGQYQQDANTNQNQQQTAPGEEAVPAAAADVDKFDDDIPF